MEKQEINVRFGIRMRELRARYDVSQEQLALRSELNRTYIGDIERGEKTPSLITLSKIAKGLGITLKEMFDYLDSINDSSDLRYDDCKMHSYDHVEVYEKFLIKILELYKKPKRVVDIGSNLNQYAYIFNNFGIVQNHYQAYAKNNAIYLGELGQMRTITPCFEEMRIFCQAEIAWDTSLRYDDLVTEFMDAYYQEAAGAMRKYYDFTRTWMSTYEYSKQVSLGGIYADLDNAALWPKGAVDQLDKHINEALAAIEPIKDIDMERYEKLYLRIKKESLTPTYLKLLHYASYYSKGEASAMKEEFRYYTKLFGITKLTEGQELNVDGLFPDI